MIKRRVMERRAMERVSRFWIVLMVFSAGVGVGFARGGEDKPLDRAERFEFDEAQGDWVDEAPPVPGTAAGDLQLARALHTNNHHRKARKALKKWHNVYGVDDPLYPRAVLLECATRIAMRDYHKAHLQLVSFLAEFSGTEYEDRALVMEFNIAEVFLSGTKRKFWGMRMLKAQDEGLSILDDIAANHAQSRLAELATLAKANYYFQTGDFAFAEQEYAYLVENFQRSRYVRPSMLQSARAALASFPGVEFDDAPLIEAEERFNQYLAQYPGAAEQEGIGLVLTDISETRGSKEYVIGRYYERAGKPRAAQFYYRSTAEHWPETIAANRARSRLLEMGVVMDEGVGTGGVDTTSESSIVTEEPQDNPEIE